MPEQLFRKRRVVIRAIQWTGDNLDEVRAFLGGAWVGVTDAGAVLLPTLHGDVPCEPGAWVCRGERDFWPVDADQFAETYDRVEPATPPLPEPDYLPGYPGKSARPPAGILERSGTAEVTAERIATYRLDHCGNCRDAEFYGRAWGHGDLHAKHVPVIEEGHGPLSGQPCACKTCVPAAESESAS